MNAEQDKEIHQTRFLDDTDFSQHMALDMYDSILGIYKSR